MNAWKNGLTVLRNLMCFTLAMWLARPAFGAGTIDETFDVLKTRTGTYTNVTVTSRATNYIFIVHANGMTTVKVQDLTLEAQQKLGYAVVPPPAVTNAPAVAPAKPIIGGEQKVLPPPPAPSALKALGVGLMLVIGAFSILSYLFFSYCCLLICFKTKTPGGILVWLPVLQAIPLFRAAGMSGWWLLGAPVACFIWPFKIAPACGKGLGMALALLFPLTSPFAFAVLAFSSGSKPAAPPQKFKPAPLPTPAANEPVPPPFPHEVQARAHNA